MSTTVTSTGGATVKPEGSRHGMGSFARQVLGSPRSIAPLIAVSAAVVVVAFLWAVSVELYLGDLEDSETLDWKQVVLLTSFLTGSIGLLLRPQLRGITFPKTSTPVETSVPIPPTPTVIKPGIVLSTPGESAATPGRTSTYKWTPSFPSKSVSQGVGSAVPVTPSTTTATPVAPKSTSISINVRTPVTATPTAISVSTPISSAKASAIRDDASYLSPSSPVVLKKMTATAEKATPGQAATDAANATEQRLVLRSILTPNQQQLSMPGTPASSGIGGLRTSSGTPTGGGTPSGVSFSMHEPSVSDEDAAYALIQRIGQEEKKPSGEALMEEWVMNLKRALREYIEHRVLGPLDRIHKKLELASIQPFPPFGAAAGPMFSIAALEWDEDQRRSDEDDIAHRLALIIANPEFSALLKARKDLEKFVTVHRKSNMVSFPKSYVLQRLRNLVKSESLSGFEWSGGEAFRGKSWSPDLPTDSEILFRVFCVWMETLVKRDEMDSFAKEYVVDAEGADMDDLKAKEWTGFLNYGKYTSAVAPTLNTSLMFMSPAVVGSSAGSGTASGSMTFRPHYKLMIKGQLWEVRARRLNLFHAIVLFLYVMRKNQMGRIQDILQEVFPTSSSNNNRLRGL